MPSGRWGSITEPPVRRPLLAGRKSTAAKLRLSNFRILYDVFDHELVLQPNRGQTCFPEAAISQSRKTGHEDVAVGRFFR